MRVLQIGTGNANRPHGQWMVDHDVALIGSGWAGRWPSDDYGNEPALRRFAEDVRPGDLVIARQGLRRALGSLPLPTRALDRHQAEDVPGPPLSRDRFARCWNDAVLRWVRAHVDGVEAKRLGDGLGYARTQGKAYADRLDHAVDLVVTDGVRYRLYPDAEPSAEPLVLNMKPPRKSAVAFFDALRYHVR